MRVGDGDEQRGTAEGRLTWRGSVTLWINFLGSNFECPSVSDLQVRDPETKVKSSHDWDICMAEWISLSWATSLPTTSIHSSWRSWFTRGVSLGPY